MGVQLIAGETAYKEIQEAGLRPQRIRLVVGASGGPKWLILSRLDQYLARQLLPQATQPLRLLGSSVGAWCMA